MQVCEGICPKFPLPATKPFSFHEVLSGIDVEATTRLERASALRADFVAALESKDADHVLTAIDAYLPYLQSIMHSLQRPGDNTFTRRGNVNFSWTTPCDKKQGTVLYTLWACRYEMTMVMSTLAYAKSSKAAALLEGTPMDDSFEPVAKQAAALYRSAAGIADFIAACVLPLPEALPLTRPPEVHPDFHRAMSFLYRCASQQISTRQALRKGMSPPLIAKLHLGGASLLGGARDHLAMLRTDWPNLSTPLKQYVTGGPGHLSAAGLLHLGRAAWDAGRRGEGLGVLRQAKPLLDAALAAGLLGFASPALHARVGDDRAAIHAALDLYERDNRLVYFELVPPWEGPPEPYFAASAAEPFVPPLALPAGGGDGDGGGVVSPSDVPLPASVGGEQAPAGLGRDASFGLSAANTSP